MSHFLDCAPSPVLYTQILLITLKADFYGLNICVYVRKSETKSKTAFMYVLRKCIIMQQFITVAGKYRGFHNKYKYNFKYPEDVRNVIKLFT